jgi:hypothetical protein
VTVTRRQFLRAAAAGALGLGLSVELAQATSWGAEAAATSASIGLAAPLDDLRARLTGALLLPDDLGYATATSERLKDVARYEPRPSARVTRLIFMAAVPTSTSTAVSLPT